MVDKLKNNNINIYFIDGNNLIGKIPELRNIKDSSSRDKLIFLLEKYFSNRKAKIVIFFDGHPTELIKSNFQLVFSYNLTADNLIKTSIDKANRNKNLIVVSSDSEVYKYARICGCTAILSEDFYKKIQNTISSHHSEKPTSFNLEEFKKIFDVE